MEKIQVKTMADLKADSVVMLPRTQYGGVKADIQVERQEFRAVPIDTDEMGRVWMVEQTAWPRMVFQVLPTDGEAEFDRVLGTLLAMKETPAYVEDCLQFMVLFQGAHDHVPLTQANCHDVDRQICATRDRAALWWRQHSNAILFPED